MFGGFSHLYGTYYGNAVFLASCTVGAHLGTDKGQRSWSFSPKHFSSVATTINGDFTWNILQEPTLNSGSVLMLAGGAMNVTIMLSAHMKHAYLFQQCSSTGCSQAMRGDHDVYF